MKTLIDKNGTISRTNDLDARAKVSNQGFTYIPKHRWKAQNDESVPVKPARRKRKQKDVAGARPDSAAVAAG